MRETLSMRFINGSGLEIGPLHAPLPLPKGTKVKYIDLFSREENIRKFPELDASKIATTDYIDDGFVLSTTPESSQDFLIANHILEHTPNPIQVLKNWFKITKSNGILFVAVPIAEECFDKGRHLTTLQHLIDDFNLYNRKKLNKILKRNKKHLVEWITVSERNIYLERNVDYEKSSSAELKKRIAETDMERCEIHFHTFSVDSFYNLISYFLRKIESLKVEAFEKNGGEVISVLRKS